MEERSNANTMEKILASIEVSLKAGAHYAALITALTLPDICGEIETGKLGSRERYLAWFNRYLYGYYNRKGYKNQVDFLIAENCYALRCSLLHQGIASISGQQSRKGSLRTIHFHTDAYDHGHCNLNCDNIEGLQLNIERFCHDVTGAVRAWLKDICQDEVKGHKVHLLMSIRGD